MSKPRNARRTRSSDRATQRRPERSRQAVVLGMGRIVIW